MDWCFSGGGEEYIVCVIGCIVINDGEVVYMLVVEGVGIVVKFIWDVGDDLLVGCLVCVLLGYFVLVVLLYVIYLYS